MFPLAFFWKKLIIFGLFFFKKFVVYFLAVYAFYVYEVFVVIYWDGEDIVDDILGAVRVKEEVVVGEGAEVLVESEDV